MPDMVRCPDCGHPNPAGRASCEACNFPLEAEATPSAPAGGPAPPAPAPPLLRRPRRPPRAMPATSMSLTLWLVFGVFCAAVVLYYGVQGFVRNNAPAVVGSAFRVSWLMSVSPVSNVASGAHVPGGLWTSAHVVDSSGVVSR